MTTPTVKISTPPEFMEDSPYAEQPLGAEGYWGGGVDNSSAAKREYMPVVCEQNPLAAQDKVGGQRGLHVGSVGLPG